MRKVIIEILKKADVFDLFVGLALLTISIGVSITMIVLVINHR